MDNLHTLGNARKAGTAEPCFFPQFIFTPGLSPGSVNAQLVPMSGIPMRDYFAAHAIQTAWEDSDTIRQRADVDDLAARAYAIADAMLKFREPEQNNSQYHGDHLKSLSDES